ncbi:hypothetical protein BGX26_007377 [Mortierella sp. AD094]|nr:hypothetical protein BGX26_007377 [Mortierella sp. AD094]
MSNTNNDTNNDADVVYERYFVKSTEPRTGSKLNEYSGVKESPGQDGAPLIPNDCAVFTFDAAFENQKPGQYCVIWKIKLLPWFRAPRGFLVQAVTTHDGNTTESNGDQKMSVVVHKARIENLRLNDWQDIIIEEPLVILPSPRGSSTINLSLRNCEGPEIGSDGRPGKRNKIDNVEESYGNFYVRSVAIRSYSKPDLDLQDFGSTLGTLPVSYNIRSTDNVRISRISAAPEVDLIATLRVEDDKIHIGVWDYSKVHELSGDTEHSSIHEELKAEKTLNNLKRDHDSPLGISLSPNGQQLVVFQEPNTGDWKDGTRVEEAAFEFQLLIVDNLVSNSGSEKPGECKVMMDDPNPASNIPSLRSFVGFAKFLPLVSPTADNKYSRSPGGDENYHRSLFAACNGIYLDVFDCNQKSWIHLHSITLTSLSPTLSRRNTCQMMMESMGPNTFLWLEAEGQMCSTWCIRNGANISRLSSEDNATSSNRVNRLDLKMAISPDESIVALAGVDGSIRTFFARSGIEIDTARHTSFKIEYLGFLGRNDRILVISRHALTRKLLSWVSDPMDLNTRIESNPVPIPTAGTALLVTTSRNPSDIDYNGMVCATEGTDLRFHRVHADPPTDQPEKHKLIEIYATIDPDNKEEGNMEFGENGRLIYGLNFVVDKQLSEDQDKGDYWILRVRVLQKHESSDREVKVLFDFIPEPWLRCSISEHPWPRNLSTAYFLPCKKRFAIIGFQSIQIWALPSKKYPMVRLLAFWSKPRDFKSLLENPLSLSEIYGKFETIGGVSVFNTHSDFTRVKVNGTEKVVSLPGLSHGHFGALPCYRSIYLLAAAYSFARENEVFESHAVALVRFAAQYINHMTTWRNVLGAELPEDIASTSKPDGVDMLHILIKNPGFQDTCNPFIKALLSTGSWIPREEMIMNPIEQAMNLGNDDIVDALITSCIENAKKRHPAYLTPATKLLDKLIKHYPSLTAKMFSEASYIKAKNKPYLSANAIVVKPPYQFWDSFPEILNDFTVLWNEYPVFWNDYPVFHLETQLPLWVIPLKTPNDSLEPMQPERIKSFPASQYGAKSSGRVGTWTPTQKSRENSHDIYVVPFSNLSTTSSPRMENRSKFISIAGTDLLDNPAMIATLRFKWYKFGAIRWAAKFSLVFTFSMIFFAITLGQIFAGSPMDRYLDGWTMVFFIVICLGGICLLYELRQFILDWKRYIFSPCNYGELLSFGLTIVGCIKFLFASNGTHFDSGPHQIWWISYALLAIYVNLLSELKVYQPFGAALNTFFRIAQKIFWFAVIFVLSLVAFTHAFLHITHTRQDRCVDLTGDDLTACRDVESNYPQDPIQAALDSFFFIAGLYDPINNDINWAYSPNYSFKFLLVFYIAFTVVMMMNLLIAIMNDAYSESRSEGQLMWLKQWSEVIAEAELFLMSQSARESRNFFPDYIYYVGCQRDVEEYKKKESEKRYKENPTGDEALTNVVKDKPQQKNPMSFNQDVKYVPNVQLQIKRLFERLGSQEKVARETFSGTNNDNPAIQKSSIISDNILRRDSWLPLVISIIEVSTCGIGSAPPNEIHSADRALEYKFSVPTIVKVHDDKIHATATTLYVYCDDEGYYADPTENETRVTGAMLLLYSAESKNYYVYYRPGEADRELGGPYQTIKSAEDIFQKAYKEKFGVEWTERKTLW